jgi:2-polyprenyl-3-methyl-5-hydroxy-6-metoxy-1,4-benzoquinol methylase
MLAFSGLPFTRADEVHPKAATNDFQQITGDDPEGDPAKWGTTSAEPAPLLKQNAQYLPEKKTQLALDIGMGGGRNAVFLAQKGFKVEGVDISETAIAKAKQLARQKKVRIRAIQSDINAYPMRADAYDVIVDIDFLERALIPKIKRALRKGGVVFFENFTTEQLGNEHTKDLRRDLLLAPGELKEMFKDFQILYYREENNGKEAKAQLIARRP